MSRNVSILLAVAMFATIILVAVVPLPGNGSKSQDHRVVKTDSTSVSATEVIRSTPNTSATATNQSETGPYMTTFQKLVTKHAGTTLVITATVSDPINASGGVSTPSNTTIPMSLSTASDGTVTLTATLGPSWSAGSYGIFFSVDKGPHTSALVITVTETAGGSTVYSTVQHWD
jgi:hypothetical protein